MAAMDINDLEDLEDGEIESDSEQPAESLPDVPLAMFTVPPPFVPSGLPDNPRRSDKHSANNESKREKKKSKEHHHRSEKEKEHKIKKERLPVFPVPGPVEDDFAGHIEKAILTALKKTPSDDLPDRIRSDKTDENNFSNDDKKRKHKKRKKHDQPDRESSKKRKKVEEDTGDAEMDEEEMMCVRGASPVLRQKETTEGAFGNYHTGEESDTYPSDGSEEPSRGPIRGDREQGRGRPGGVIRDRRHERPKLRHDFRRQDPHSMENETVCPYYMQGNCYKGNDCPYSHDAQLPRKMELCKFYLMECCAKRDKCLYLHSDFPCKYYHTGLHCEFKDNCKFAHGKPLSDNLIMILLKHIETAPKEILGDFPRLTRENASSMVADTQNRLRQQYKMDGVDIPERNNAFNEKPPPGDLPFLNDKNKPTKIRSSRWCDPSTNDINNDTISTQNILNSQNLNGVLSSKQISDLAKLGIENLNQISQLTVMQLNQLGLTMNQINEIQLNIQKLGLVGDQSSKSYLNNIKSSKDLDMRVSPALPELPILPAASETTGKDVDMRYLQASVSLNIKSEKENKIEDPRLVSNPNKIKNSIDIDQYTKDALKFSNIERNNVSGVAPNVYKEEHDKHSKKEKDIPKELDVDHRLHKYVRDATVANVKLAKDDYEASDCDTDIRLANLPPKQQEMYMRIHKKIDTKDRRPTTDDDEDNLQIDEKWYSSDEDRTEKVVSKIKSPPRIVQQVITAPSYSQTLEPGTVITKLGDLSKIDISAEVTKLLTTIKSSIPIESTEPPTKKEQIKSRDPRSHAKKSPEHKSDTTKKTLPKPEASSIYDCIEGGNADGRRRTDVDLRPTKDLDYRIPSFGDTDLRLMPSGGDVDLRLGLPFKPLPNYTPATEIDGSISSHLPITYKVHIVHIPRPDYTDIRNSTVASQAGTDPRLRKIFRLSLEDNPLEAEKPAKSTAVRIDPRKRPKESTEVVTVKSTSLDIQSVIQTSNWYKELSSNQKILVNQQLATVTSCLKKFSQDPAPGKVFDLSEIKRNDVLSMIFNNLGVTLDEKGEFSHVKVQENVSSNMPMPPMNFNQNPSEMFPGMGGIMERNMMGMNPMNGGNHSNMNNMNNMPPLNPFGFSSGDPRGGPGLLGIAPNMPHNFENSNFNGMPNFNQDNNFSNNFDSSNSFNNGPPGKMNDFNSDNNNYDDNNKFYNRNNKKNDYKSFRGGRGGDRWNRGNSRGGRDRRGFTDRGSWKNDRR